MLRCCWIIDPIGDDLPLIVVDSDSRSFFCWSSSFSLVRLLLELPPCPSPTIIVVVVTAAAAFVLASITWSPHEHNRMNAITTSIIVWETDTLLVVVAVDIVWETNNDDALLDVKLLLRGGGGDNDDMGILVLVGAPL